jgi:hypothetical protein
MLINGRRRSPAALTTKVFGLALLALCVQGCGTTVRLGSEGRRSAPFAISYEDAKTRLSQLRPSVRLGRKLPVRGSEPVPGQKYVLRIREGGGAPGGRWTEIRVSKVTETSCYVDIYTWTSNTIFPSHRAWHTERRRWRELSELLSRT